MTNKRFVCFVLLICVTVMGLISTSCGSDNMKAGNTVSAEQPAETPEKTQREKSYAQLPDGAELVDVQKCLIISDDLNLDVPEDIHIYDHEKIVIDEQMGAELIRNLSDNGWNKHQFDAVEDGFYFIGCFEDNPPGDKVKDEKAQCEKFMQDSGLGEILKAKDIEMEYDTYAGANLYWLTEQRQTTSSYIRLGFENSKTCVDCKMYLYDSTVIDTLPSVAIQEALESAFCFPENDDDQEFEYSVNHVELIYVQGLPYYHYTGLGTEILGILEVYALAVNLEDIKDNESLMSRYMSFQWP